MWIRYASSFSDAAAKTVNGGNDLELGDQVWAPLVRILLTPTPAPIMVKFEKPTLKCAVGPVATAVSPNTNQPCLQVNGGMGLLQECVEHHTVNESRVDESVRRALNLRFITGQFDPLDDQPYAKIGIEAINTTHTQQLVLEAAQQSFVLLKNDDNTLPFTRGKKTAVLGPYVL